jgi:hypothetical protein
MTSFANIKTPEGNNMAINTEDLTAAVRKEVDGNIITVLLFKQGVQLPALNDFTVNDSGQIIFKDA